MNSSFRPSRFNLLPEVVKNLLIINGLMYIASVVLSNAFGIDLEKLLGLYYIGSDYFRPYQLVTHLFMHGSFWHLFSNMFALWMFGNILENYWGQKKFLTYYVITGLGAALIHSGVIYYQLHALEKEAAVFSAGPTPQLFADFIRNNITFGNQFEGLLNEWSTNPFGGSHYAASAVDLVSQFVEFKKNIPTVGASGAVFGVLLAFGMLFPNTLIYLYFAIPIKAKYFVMFYGLYEFYSGFQNSPEDNVAHFAHLGGMLFGFILIRIWNRRRSDMF